MRKVLFAAVTLSLIACGPNTGSDPIDPNDPNDPNDPMDPMDPMDPPVQEACNKMDIVFIVDDSGSMGEEQTNLEQNFPQFASLIHQYINSAGKELDYRIAVTTTGRDIAYEIEFPQLPGFPPIDPIPQNESGDNGVFRQDCGMTKPWVERADGDAATTFACAARVGTGGPSLEMPLLITRMALQDRMSDGSNAGFLRDDALLALVMLTDEDDCSRTDNNFTIENDQGSSCTGDDPVTVAETIGFLDNLTGNRGRWASAVIAGETSCTSEFGDAVEASRLKDFVNQAGENSVFSSICAGDLTQALEDALDTFEAVCEGFPPID